MSKRVLIPLGVLTLLTVISGVFLSSNFSFASTEETKSATVTVMSACTMFRESTISHVATGTAGNYYQDIGTTRLNTMCNDKDGYAIYAIGYSNDEEGNTNMIGENTNELIPTSTETGDVSNWSMKVAKDLESYLPENLTILDGYDYYHAIPSTQTKIASFTGATDTTKGSVITTTYAVRVSPTQLADTYTGQVKYTMVHPSDGTAPDGPTPPRIYIQDINPNNCPKERTLVYDKRDEEPYYIQEITTNGTTLCWMTSNLNLAGGSVLTSALSNVKPGESYTLPQSSLSGFYTYGVANVYNSGSTECDTNSPCYSYYNYTAATLEAYVAPESYAEYDICPAGWRLPRDTEYESLVSVYGAELANAPWYAQKAGRIGGGSPVVATGVLGAYWSGNTSRTSGAYPYALYVTDTPSGGNDSGFTGFSIRCVAKAPEPPKTYIQDITLSECKAAGEEMLVYDKRDDKPYTIKYIGDDCWMTQNLDLDGGTPLYSETSNVPDGYSEINNSAFYTMPESDPDGFYYDTPPMQAFVYNTNNTDYTGNTACYSYYSWPAATAGTNNNVASENTQYDICPKGWHLPTRDDVDPLFTATGGPVIVNSVWKGAYNGMIASGSVNNAGSSGFMWLSANTGDFTAHAFMFNSSYSTVITSHQKSLGLSVRCIANETYIQDVTLSDCPSEPTKVYDRRDNKAYYIQKLEDNNCWMLDNLALELDYATPKKLKGNTNATDAAIEYLLGNKTGTTEDRWPTAGITTYWNGSYSYSVPMISKTNMNTEFSYGDGTNKAGIYYNWCAATAGTYCYGNNTSSPSSVPTDDPVEDICPSGWRMPTSTGTAEYSGLLGSYSSLADALNALRAPKAGFYVNSTTYEEEESAGLWSSSSNSSAWVAYVFHFSGDINYTSPAWVESRYYGYNVRCIAKNGNDPEQDSKLYIQDITTANCPSTPTIAFDKRDDEAYLVQLLNDGNCWMLENLRLGSNTTTNLTSENTNIASNYTLPASITSGFGSRTEPQIYIGTKNNKTSYGDGNTFIGVYYNYCAASAGTVCSEESSSNAEYDICPAGWRMPTGGDGVGEYKTLYDMYGNNYSTFRNALRIPFSGELSDGVMGPSESGFMWSSTGYGNVYSFHLFIDSSQVFPSDKADRSKGSFVRCVAKESTPTISIQNVTQETCPTVPTKVYDTRDGDTYTIQRLADGHCWMIENLRLGGSTSIELSSNNTNLPSGATFTLPANNMSGSSPSYTNAQINTNYENTIVSYGGLTGKQGVYYNYCAASAGTFCTNTSETTSHDTRYDICPKGWHLPTSGTNFDLSKKEYSALYAAYNYSGSNFKNAFKSMPVGFYVGGSLLNLGNYTVFPSASYSSSENMLGLGAANGGTYITPEDRAFRNYGYPVRCVADYDPEVPHDIQNVTISTCPTTPTTVYDTRDGNAYTIAMLEDGNCWMLDNLNLGTRALKVLTPEDTNIGADFTLPASSDVGVSSYTLAQINIDSRNDTLSYGNGENKVGVYYNYCAATAGSYCDAEGEAAGNAPQDICPKGWRLPTGGEYGEYQYLINSYNDAADFKNALHTALYGYFKYSSTNHVGRTGSFWTSTGTSDDHVYSLDVRSNRVNQDYSSNRNAAISIRCILK